MNKHLNLLPIPAFSDNYFWLMHDGQRALVVDPGDEAPIISTLETLDLTLESILITHHHIDHVGGLQALSQYTQAKLYGPAGETMPVPVIPLGQGDEVKTLSITFRVLDVPGHTAGHIAYVADLPYQAPVLFCGDTLFSGGCGRLFEGTPAQMLASLDALSSLAENTRVCCAHEYTLSNLRFAKAIEPQNAELAHYTLQCQHLRSQGLPTLPSTIATERAINPFLRSRVPTVVQAVQHHASCDAGEVDIFAALREWKNQFK
jgi:hydroxyacylglutathione hydrolase